MSTSQQTTNEAVDTWAAPVAYVSMQDDARRDRIVSLLEGAGWTVITRPTGFHLVQAIAGVIEGRSTCRRASLIVIDARSRGCAGTTIAAGLRDLGITIPIVLVASQGEALPVSPDRALRIVDASAADAEVAELAAMAIVSAPAPRRPAA